MVSGPDEMTAYYCNHVKISKVRYCYLRISVSYNKVSQELKIDQ